MVGPSIVRRECGPGQEVDVGEARKTRSLDGSAQPPPIAGRVQEFAFMAAASAVKFAQLAE
jgi:hypothetical protein